MKSKSQEFLEKIAILDEHIEQLKFELSELEKNCTYIRAVNYEQSGRGSKKNEAAFEKNADKIADLELEINREIAELEQRRYDAIRLIQRLENPQQSKILFLRYIKKMTYEEIMSSIGYAKTFIYTTCRTALEELDKIVAE